MSETELAVRRKKPRHRSGLAPMAELRFFAASGLEVRAASDGSDGMEITGEPIVYDTAYRVRDMYGSFSETMKPGVVTNLLATGCDTRLLFNHGGLPLARTVSGTLTLTDSATALQFTAGLDARQQVATDLAVAIERGDVSQMSCGFLVAEDEWSDDEAERTIFRLSELLDISPVTYPASPTTSVAMAQRMLTSLPIESRARIRRMWSISRDIREGKQLSAAAGQLLAGGLEALYEADEERAAPTEQDGKIATALQALKSAHADVVASQAADPDNATDPDDANVSAHLKAIGSAIDQAILAQAKDGSTDPAVTRSGNATVDPGPDGTQNAPAPDPASAQDGTGSRSAVPATAQERRDASLSFGDQESLVYTALVDHLGSKAGDDDGCVDIWIRDLGTDWVVWNSWMVSAPGLWRLSYSLDGDVVTFTGDPEQVNEITSYESAEPSESAPAATASRALELELELMEMRRGRSAA